MFRDREAAKQLFNLPAVVFYSFVGESTPDWQARVEEIVVGAVGEQNVRHRSAQASSKGRYTAYRFEIFHIDFEDVETIYREVGALPGTRYIL